ncbi:MAG TPA: sulfite exporter TauE/SafE family protein [Actinobacteria bacterium]|nr:sulfite exporter TauE/SafE family protein [Actinomycetes bacterium]HEX21594.1 sulfite exporter TauE/SafE family protein [Actinomycetota bacterium]
MAVGTPLVVNIPTALAGLYAYNKQGFVDYKLVPFLALPGIVGAIAGSYGTRFVNGSIILLITAGVIFILGLRVPFNYRNDAGEREVKHLYLLIFGFLIGLFSGFLGLGGGFLLVPFLTLFIRKDVKSAFGTSLAVIAAITIPAAVVHFYLGHVDLRLAGLLILGAVPGAFLGSRVAVRLSNRLLRVAFSLLLLVLAGYLGYNELVRLVS